MNPLIILLIATSAGTSLAFWQQSSVHRMRGDVARTARELAIVRSGIDINRAQLTQAEARLAELRRDASQSSREQAQIAAAEDADLTPQKEGWWPSNRPYFYLAKSSLPKVRFRQIALKIDELNARLTQQAKMLNPTVISVSVTPDSRGAGEYQYRFFEAGKINRDLTTLLEMDDSQAAAVDELYSGLRRDVRAVEAAHVVRVDPPESANPRFPQQVIVARIPELSAEVNPLIDAVNQQLTEMLGATRGQLLADQAKAYFTEYEDGLGDKAREFVRDGGALIVQIQEKWGKRQKSGSWTDYPYLFGPGAPCELK